MSKVMAKFLGEAYDQMENYGNDTPISSSEIGMLNQLIISVTIIEIGWP
jgi:hypothetical protein